MCRTISVYIISSFVAIVVWHLTLVFLCTRVYCIPMSVCCRHTDCRPPINPKKHHFFPVSSWHRCHVNHLSKGHKEPYAWNKTVENLNKTATIYIRYVNSEKLNCRPSPYWQWLHRLSWCYCLYYIIITIGLYLYFLYIIENILYITKYRSQLTWD